MLVDSKIEFIVDGKRVDKKSHECEIVEALARNTATKTKSETTKTAELADWIGAKKAIGFFFVFKKTNSN